jgi:hypothetical protein
MIPKKPAPGLTGWKMVFGKDHAQTKELDFDPIQSDRIKACGRSRCRRFGSKYLPCQTNEGPENADAPQGRGIVDS